ncbi:Trypomastigote, Alanine, Serine and Valine rich protein (TASV), subfamily A [Trypanosoma cruzi]|uniref:Trypomastigote, Alanine, Serine and Valine rich protein (TASV), subfamily A n=1 Tax=Trypanosoma cruzi TaxID=5693 RepID=A0A2V2WPR3_TRYCR|nr:Trypomastigote, Alanine, Serine and Valine rich protein (TASV), subfamily A [Trypanosoma cruzi]
MMMMATVRRGVACYMLVLALLCSSCCMSVRGAAASGVETTAALQKTWTDVEVSCLGTDGRLSWRPSGENDWRRCAKKPGEYESVTDDCARLCDDAGEFYKWNITGQCPPEGAGGILPSRCDLRRTGIYKTALRRRQKTVLSWALAMRNQASRNRRPGPRLHRKRRVMA